jgi:uncharacterized protein YjbI with pentapeptide repeats
VQANLTNLKKTKACSGYDLSGIELISFDLRGADLSRANLTGANLRKSDLTRANLTDTNLTGGKLSYANINGVEMSNVMLGGAKLNNVKVVKSRISYSDMTGTNNTDLADTRVSGKTLKDTVLCKTIMPSRQKNRKQRNNY